MVEIEVRRAACAVCRHDRGRHIDGQCRDCDLEANVPPPFAFHRYLQMAHVL